MRRTGPSRATGTTLRIQIGSLRWTIHFAAVEDAAVVSHAFAPFLVGPKTADPVASGVITLIRTARPHRPPQDGARLTSNLHGDRLSLKLAGQYEGTIDLRSNAACFKLHSGESRRTLYPGRGRQRLRSGMSSHPRFNLLPFMNAVRAASIACGPSAGLFFVHSCCLVVGGKAAVLAGQSGAGKSTTAAVFDRQSITEDITAIQLVRARSLAWPTCFDSPPCVKARVNQPYPLSVLGFLERREHSARRALGRGAALLALTANLVNICGVTPQHHLQAAHDIIKALGTAHTVSLHLPGMRTVSDKRAFLRMLFQ